MHVIPVKAAHISVYFLIKREILLCLQEPTHHGNVVEYFFWSTVGHDFLTDEIRQCGFLLSDILHDFLVYPWFYSSVHQGLEFQA